MNKRYIIKSKFRFICFMVSVILFMTVMVSVFTGNNIVNSAAINQYEAVKVEAGDTLWDIAYEHTYSNKDIREVVYDICQLNDIKASQLQPGEIILVPIS